MTGTYPPLESVNGSLGSAAWGGGGDIRPFKARFAPRGLQSGKEGTRGPIESSRPLRCCFT